MPAYSKKVIFALAALALCTVALFANALWVDSQTRGAAARDGGQIIGTSIVPANVKVEGAGLPIVLIHGFGAAIDWWDNIAPDLATDHRVIRVDLIGHGGTTAPRSGYSIKRQAALISAIVDKLGIDRFTVIGHSMGGEVATALAEMKSERIEHMVLIDSPSTVGTTFTITTEAYLTPLLGELLSHFQSDRAIHRGLGQGFAQGFAVPEKFVADLKQLTYTSFRMAHEESMAYRKSKPLYERIAALKPLPPLLVVFGARDAIVCPEQAKLFEQVPGARVTIIQGAGHSPMVESPVKVLELIREFLRLSP